jgi:hypothetical protein
LDGDILTDWTGISSCESPPWNPVIDLQSLNHKEFVKHAEQVIRPLNPEGHPPPGVNAPSMRVLIDRLELAKKNDLASYASGSQVGGCERTKEGQRSKLLSFSRLGVKIKVRDTVL